MLPTFYYVFKSETHTSEGKLLRDNNTNRWRNTNTEDNHIIIVILTFTVIIYNYISAVHSEHNDNNNNSDSIKRHTIVQLQMSATTIIIIRMRNSFHVQRAPARIKYYNSTAIIIINYTVCSSQSIFLFRSLDASENKTMKTHIGGYKIFVYSLECDAAARVYHLQYM